MKVCRWLMGKRSSRISHQASSRGLFSGVDNTRTPKELKGFLEFDLKQSLTKDRDGWYQFKDSLVSIKNITYLGHPNPLGIKRAQFSNNLRLSFNSNPSNKIVIGHYINAYKERRYVIWDLSSSKVGLSKSSHVKIDIIEKSMITSTTVSYSDKMGNKITVIPPDQLLPYLTKGISGSMEVEELVMKFASHIFESHNKLNYKSAIEWMKTNDSKNWTQIYWNGFYFEDVARILFDDNEEVEVPSKEKFGNFRPDMFYKIPIDIKYHSSSHNKIFGNDLVGVSKVIEKYGRLLYIIIQGSTENESDNFEVKKFVKALDKKDYINKATSKKRPKDIAVAEVYTLLVTNDNIDDLPKFQEGWVNSNGNARNPKIFLDPDKLKKEDYTK